MTISSLDRFVCLPFMETTHSFWPTKRLCKLNWGCLKHPAQLCGWIWPSPNKLWSLSSWCASDTSHLRHAESHWTASLYLTQCHWCFFILQLRKIVEAVHKAYVPVQRQYLWSAVSTLCLQWTCQTASRTLQNRWHFVTVFTWYHLGWSNAATHCNIVHYHVAITSPKSISCFSWPRWWVYSINATAI
jgi:hypothetical protein